MTADKPITNTTILQQLIQNNNRSQMQTEINYFETNNELIQSKETNDFTQTFKIPSGFYSDIVCQTANYVVGKPVTITGLKDNTTIDINDFITNLAIESRKLGIGWLYLYLNEGKLKTRIINSYEVIPIWDTNFQEDLIQLIRYYKVEVIDNTGASIRTRVECWDDEKVIYYLEDEKGVLDLDLIFTDSYIQYHINNSTYLLDTAIEKVGEGWGKIPFIPLKSNKNLKSELTTSLKACIDGYDNVISGFMDDLSAIQDALLLIKDRSAEEYDELMYKIKKYKCLKVDDTGDAKYLISELPFNARKDIETTLENNIYKFARAVNMDELTRGGGQITTAFIESLFFKLNQKGNEFIKQINEFLYELFEFINIYRTKMGLPLENIEELTFTYNLSIPSNENETITTVNSCKGIISNKTLLSKHPLINDVEEELKLIAEEEEQFLNSEVMNNDISKPNNEDIQNDGNKSSEGNNQI